MSKYSVNNTDPGVLQTKIKEAQKTAKYTKQQLGRAYDLFEIVLHVDEPYYNLVNYRSKKECDEYIKEHNLPEDTFSQENFFSKSSQQHYHEIIYRQVLEDKNTREAYEAEFGNAEDGGKEATQTQNLYLSFDGVLANGNSRTSYWRENPPKNITSVKYWVFADGISWQEIEDAVLTIDARADITQKLPWYNRADKARERSKGIVDKKELSKIAKSQQYRDAGHMNKEIERLQLAERFINTKRLKKFNTFKDLSNLGTGSGSQVFDTLQKGVEKARKDKFKALISMPNVMDSLIEDSFTIIDNQAKSLANAKDAHIGVGLLFKDQRLIKLIKANTGKDEITDPIIGSNSETSSKKTKKHKSINEIDAELLKSSESEKLAAAKRNTEALAKNLTDMNTKIEGYEVLLNETTNYQSAKKAMKNLLKTVNELDKKIDKAVETEDQ